MKKTFIGLVAMLVVSLACAQKIQQKAVPIVVKNGLQKQFPLSKNVTWEHEKPNYEAGFELNKTEYSVLIDASGNILETEVEISVEALPTNVRANIAKNYAGKKIKEAAKITDSKGKVTYEVEVNGKDLLFDQNGTIIK